MISLGCPSVYREQHERRLPRNDCPDGGTGRNRTRRRRRTDRAARPSDTGTAAAQLLDLPGPRSRWSNANADAMRSHVTHPAGHYCYLSPRLFTAPLRPFRRSRCRTLHVRPQHGIHPRLISRPALAKPLEHIGVHAKRDGNLRFRQDGHRVIPKIGRQITQLFRCRADNVCFRHATQPREIGAPAAGFRLTGPGRLWHTLGAHDDCSLGPK